MTSLSGFARLPASSRSSLHGTAMHPPPKIVGLGLATLDILIRVTEMPTWGSHAPLEDVGLDGGGMTATAMVAVERLGVPAGYMGTAGGGYAGDLFLRSITERGVDTSRVIRREGPERRVVVVYINAEGDRMFSGLRGWGDNWLLPDEIDRDYLTAADYLLIDGFHYEASLAAAQLMHEAGKKVLFDGSEASGPIDDRIRLLLRHVDYLVCGTGFVPGLTGEADIWKAGRAALAAGPSVVVQTEGADGAYTVTADEEFHTPAFPIEVVDTTGAGDVFHGAYLVGLTRGWPLRDVATFASAAAAIKCTKLGGRAGIPAFEDVRTFLGERGISVSVRPTAGRKAGRI
jgi:sulfofructose kinase